MEDVLCRKVPQFSCSNLCKARRIKESIQSPAALLLYPSAFHPYKFRVVGVALSPDFGPHDVPKQLLVQPALSRAQQEQEPPCCRLADADPATRTRTCPHPRAPRIVRISADPQPHVQEFSFRNTTWEFNLGSVSNPIMLCVSIHAIFLFCPSNTVFFLYFSLPFLSTLSPSISNHHSVANQNK